LIKRHMFISSAMLVLLFTVKSAAAESWTIIDAVKSAISTHPQSLIAESLVEEAQGEHRTSLALEPLDISARYDDIPSNSRLSDHEERRIGISQQFEFPLRYYWLKKAADFTIDYARNESRGVLLDLESDVRQIYLEAWAQSEHVKILEEYRDSIKTHCSFIEEISKYGGVSRLDARRSRVKAIEAENELRASQRSKAAAYERLASMTKYDLTDIELISPLEIDPVDTAGLVESNLFASNPDILAAQSEVSISGYEKTLATTDWLPELELTYYHRHRTLPDDPDAWALQLDLTIPLWFWWGGFGEIQISKARLKRARAELASCRLELSSECSMLIQQLKSDYEQYELLQRELLPLVKDEYLMLHRNVFHNADSYMDLIDAQDDLKDIQQDNIEIIYELYEKKISLDRLIGKSILDGMSK